MSRPSADGPLGAASRAAAADPADDGITTVTVTVLEDPRGGATRVSRKRDDAPLGDDDDASLCRSKNLFSSDAFGAPRGGARGNGDIRDETLVPSDDLPDDDVWNAVLTAFEAHCLRGGDAAGDEALAAAAAADETSPADGDAFAFSFARADALADATRAPGSYTSGFGVDGDVAGDSATVAPRAATHYYPYDDLNFFAPFADAADAARPAPPGLPEPFDAQRIGDDAIPRARDEPESRLGDASEPLGASSATVAELVRANAARALRSLIFGRDDGRGRRRRAVEGPRVSRRRPKQKKETAAKAASAAEKRADDAEDRDHRERIVDVFESSTSSDEESERDFPESESLLPDDASRAGAHYARRDPARWRDAATTASSVAAVAARAAAASRDAAVQRDPSSSRKIASLRAAFAVELERLAAVERGLAAGERGALARLPGPAPGPRAGTREAASEEDDGVSSGAAVAAVARVASEATRAMRASTAARFRECRFRILETFERDVAARLARGARVSPGRGSVFSQKKKRRVNAPPELTEDSVGGVEGDARGVATESLPAVAAKGKSRHSARARAVLEAWLAEHFYPTATRRKPVPTREEKRRLALETGLTERQVGDWFVNARARVWKPEMQALLGEMREK